MTIPIGGFMPIPLAMMIPFMATQSMVMGDAFGRAFQYGKRKISAMSNEEFNATSIEQQASEMFKSYKLIIPDLQESIIESRKLQGIIISEMIKIVPEFLAFISEGLTKSNQPSIQTESPTRTSRPTTADTERNPQSVRIVSSVTTNGITTTTYSDGTTSTSGTQSVTAVQRTDIRYLNKLQTSVNSLQILASRSGSAGQRSIRTLTTTVRKRDIQLRKYITLYGKPKYSNRNGKLFFMI